MKTKSLITFFCLFLMGYLDAQVTTYFYGRDKIESKGETAALYSVEIYKNNTRVTVELIPTRNRSRMNYWTSRNTYIVIDDNHKLPILGFQRKVNGEDVIDTSPFSGTWGWDHVKKDQKYYYTMVFHGRIPPGITKFTLVDKGDYNGSHGYGWSNYTLNNPRIGGTFWTETSVKIYCNNNNDGICGIYEDVSANGNGYKLGCVKENGEYKLLYLGSKERMSWWQTGDVKAILRPSATNGVYKADWYMADKGIESNVHVFFDGMSMKTIISLDNTYANSGTEEDFYLKMYPTASSNAPASSNTQSEWSGSGFALNSGYLVTNYHVVENARSIKVKGVNGGFYTAYNAEVVAMDKYNDLALLKIKDSRFSGFEPIPYKVKTSTSEVGEEIFVLGYPLTSTMGDEIKLTTGVISSKTGFQGDVSLYQMSAPVQPGNSGGPLFDSKGNLIGIVNSKHTGAESVGYAIKASYLSNLVESSVSFSILPSNNTISSQPLTGKVKAVKNFVFMIECSTSNNYNSYPQTTQSYNSIENGHNEDIKSIEFSDVFLENDALRFELVGINMNAQNTVLVKRCVPKHIGRQYFVQSYYSEFIEDAETHEKYYLVESSVAMAPEKTIGTAERTFTETYPKLPSKVKVINVWSGSTYYIKNYRIRN